MELCNATMLLGRSQLPTLWHGTHFESQGTESQTSSSQMYKDMASFLVNEEIPTAVFAGAVKHCPSIPYD